MNEHHIAMRAAYESFAPTINQDLPTAISNFFKEVLPNVKKSMANSFSKLKSDDYPELAKESRVFLSKIAPHNYLATREFRCYIPSGFRGNYSEYLAVLHGCATHSSGVSKRVLSDYATKLATAVGTSVNYESLKVDEKVRKNRMELNEAVSHFFAATSNQSTESTVKHHVARNSEWADIFVYLEKTKTHIDSHPIAQIRCEIKKIEAYFEAIYEQYVEGKTKGMTREQLINLADLAYEMAEEMEFLAITHYRFLTMENALLTTMRFISSKLK
jgi:hypothetical protein